MAAMPMPAGHAGALEESPLGIPSHKLAMWMFIMADGATFGAMLFAYGFLRAGTLDWTKPFALWPSIANGCLMTVVLLSSSLTIHLAVAALRDARTRAFLLWWAFTIALGAVFLGGTAREWRHLIYDVGLTIRTNLFGTSYYSLVGLHAFHVTVGLLGLSLVLVLGLGEHVRREHAGRLDVLSLYWHFVDAVWVVVFTVVYVIGR